MINNATSVPLSGLQAANKQLAASASNTANQLSTTSNVNGELKAEPYRAVEVVNQSLDSRGVRSDFRESARPNPVIFQPDNIAADENGLVTLPNTDQVSDTVTRLQAEQSFRANLQVFSAIDDTLGSLLDRSE